MAPRQCTSCNAARAVLRRPKNGRLICRACFLAAFEDEVHETIVSHRLFRRGERVAIGASGGKDSTVLAHVMKLLNERHGYGIELVLLSIDEGITGYRDDSLESVKRNQRQYDLPLKVLGYDELYGWTMDEIVQNVGKRNNCTYCGVLRRQALDRGAASLGVDHIVTGHNADDMAETVLMNGTSAGDRFSYDPSKATLVIAARATCAEGAGLLRGDIARLARCTAICTQGSETSTRAQGGCGGAGDEDDEAERDDFAIISGIRRSKPFKYAYEKEIVMYAYFRRLDYFSTECLYSPTAYRGFAREYLRDLERIRASAVLDVIRSGESLRVSSRETQRQRTQRPQRVCTRCGYMSSNEVCKACGLLEALDRGRAGLAVETDGGGGGSEAGVGRDGIGGSGKAWSRAAAYTAAKGVQPLRPPSGRVGPASTLEAAAGPPPRPGSALGPSQSDDGASRALGARGVGSLKTPAPAPCASTTATPTATATAVDSPPAAAPAPPSADVVAPIVAHPPPNDADGSTRRTRRTGERLTPSTSASAKKQPLTLSY